METTILKTLKYTQATYDMIVFNTFVAWCEEHAVDDLHFQYLLIDNKLYNWFMSEYKNKEIAFMKTIKPFVGKYPLHQIRKYYDIRTTQIKFYPKMLLQRIKRKVTITAKNPNYNQPALFAYNPN